MSFRKKHKKAQEEDENVKVAYAADDGKDQSAKSQPQQAAQEPSAQPSGQESGQAQDQGGDEEGGDSSDDSEPVPDGTTAEILHWVGDNQGRAQRALDKEQANDRPRAGLTGELKKILGQ